MPNYKRSAARKRLAGTYRGDRAKPPVKGNGVAEAPEPPEHLSEQAQAEWRRLAPIVAAQNTLTQADLRGFEILCDTLAAIVEAQKVIAAEGLTIVTARGGVRSHPAIKTLESARAHAIRMLNDYGLTPRARNHVEPTNDPDPKNPFAELG